MADIRLWVASGGTLIGFAAWQTWWAVLDFYVRPGPLRAAVEEAIFRSAPTRLRALDAARGRALPYRAEAREDERERLPLLLEMLARFKALGAEEALVETGTSRRPAHLTYEAVGFRPIHLALWKRRWFS